MWRWIDPDGIKSGRQPTEKAAIRNAIYNAPMRGGQKRIVDDATAETLWKGMKRDGWDVEPILTPIDPMRDGLP